MKWYVEFIFACIGESNIVLYGSAILLPLPQPKPYSIIIKDRNGEFVYALVVAEAMYDGDYYSASGGGKIKVAE
jgi:hypothetical protein